jgi:SAM-dependent methyltransferase
MPASPPILGTNTATPQNLAYRVGKIAPYLSGRWLDYGCAEGGYAEALLSNGASSVVGVDVDEGRISQAIARGIPNATFQVFNGYELESKDNSFDGAFVNEVLEYVADEQASLRDIYRVLRPSGRLVLISPNRWFPFEGHGATIMNVELGFPTPLIPWLPGRFTRHWLHARNYWPHQLAAQVQDAGFVIHDIGFIWPVLDTFRWLPPPLIPTCQRWMERLDRTPGVRRFGLSTLVVATKPSKP